MQNSNKAARSRNRLPETGIARPHIIMLAELVVETNTALILASNDLGCVKSIEIGARDVRGGKEFLGVVDHVLVNHVRGNLAARRTRCLHVARRYRLLRVAVRIA